MYNCTSNLFSWHQLSRLYFLHDQAAWQVSPKFHQGTERRISSQMAQMDRGFPTKEMITEKKKLIEN